MAPRQEKKRGVYAIYGTLLLTFLLWLLSKSRVQEIFNYPFASLNQISALLGTVLFSWSLLLSTRLKVIEDIFGGLDKVYLIHRKTSKFGFLLIVLHPIFLALNQPEQFLQWFLPFNANKPTNLGIIGFWLFTYLVLMTLFMRDLAIRYHVWYRFHKLINLAMAFSLVHILLIQSDTSSYAPLGAFIYAVAVIGTLAGLYKLIFYRTLSSHAEYKIVQIKKIFDTYDIRLRPTNKKLSYKPGQYVFTMFKNKQLGNELHPYCIASSPKEDTIRLVIKQLGDYTNKLDVLRIGDVATFYGPHGRISEKFYADDKEAILIGGGIGIAPFLAMFRLDGIAKKSQKKVTLYYCTRGKEDAPFDQELALIAQKTPQFTYFNHRSREGDGHLQVENIVKNVKNIQNVRFFLCTTGKMAREIQHQLKDKGVLAENVITEDFDML